MIYKTEKWQELSREVVFENHRKIEKTVFRLPNGQENDFYIKKEGPAVSVVALTKGKKVILTKQFRPGPNKVLLELPGGYIDTDETPEVAIGRELAEETGYKGKLRLIAQCYDDAYSTMQRYCFIATECRKFKELQPKNNEFIEIVFLSITKFINLLRSGKMTDIEVGFLGLDYLREYQLSTT